MNTGLYIHIPFCNKKCRYCNFYSLPPANGDIKNISAAIIKEFDSRRDDLNFDTVYIGGGSPCCIGDELFSIIDNVNSRLTARPVEFTVEISPENANDKLFQMLLSLGVNRVSIGVQSFNQAQLDFLGRRYAASKIYDTIGYAINGGFENISIDLIFAIPNQTIEDWQKTVEEAIKSKVPHISAYSLSIEADTVFEEMLKTGKIKPADEETDRISYKSALQIFNSAGIKQYEISNFAKKNFQCRHNLKYWNNDDYLGLGPSAGSFVSKARTQNTSNIRTYIADIDKDGFSFEESRNIDEIEFACETAVLGLRKIDGINLEHYKSKTGYDFTVLFDKALAMHLDLKNLILTDGFVCLADNALPIANAVLADFSDI